MNSTPQIFYKKLEQNFEKRGYINLEQKEVNSKQDLVEISNIFNSKRYELFRIIYLKDNKIKGYETITSHLPNAVMVIKNTDKYYLVHNHPSGVSYASNDDMRLTQNFITNIKGFKGHLILGDNNYSFIEENKKHQLTKTEQIPYNLKEIQNISEKIDNFYNSKTLKPNLTEEQLRFFENYKVNSRTALVNLIKAIDIKKDFTPVIFTNTKLKIMMIIEESFIANKNIDEISAEDIQGYLNSQVNYSDSTIKKLKEQFGQAFNYAINKGYIVKNPMLEVIRPKSLKDRPEIRAMTIDEETKFVNYIISKDLKDCPYRNEFLIQLFMGLRIGECLALSTTDIDLEHKKMYVHKTLTNDVNGRVIMSNRTKTKAGTRYLPIPHLYILILLNKCKLQIIEKTILKIII